MKLFNGKLQVRNADTSIQLENCEKLNEMFGGKSVTGGIVDTPWDYSKYIYNYDSATETSVTMWFVKDVGTGSPYSLFLVEKDLGEQDASTENVFISMSQSISNELGISGTRFDTKCFAGPYNERTLVKGIIGQWTYMGKQVFLIVQDKWGIFGGGSRVDFLYISQSGWQKFINALAKSHEEETQSEMKQGQDLMKNF